MAGTRAIPVRKTMMAALFMVVTVLMSTTALGNKGRTSTPATVTCSQSAVSAGISVEVDADTKRASFVCGTGFNQVLPSSKEGNTVTKCYMTEEAVGQEENEKSLVELFGDGSQATVKAPGGGGSEVTLSLGKLPQRMTTVYFGCEKPATSSGLTGTGSAGGAVGAAVGGLGGRRLAAAKATAEKCVVTVTVPADPAANTPLVANQVELSLFSIVVSHPNQLASRNFRSLSFSLSGGRVCHCAPGCYSPMRAACTVAKQNMDLEITNESKSVSFQCDTDIDNLTPEKSSDLIFDESCQEQVKLSEKLPSASLTKTNSGYTFSVEELPETAATFCYKCSAAAADRKEPPAEESTACNVKINVSAADLDSAASSVATTGSVPLLTSGLAISFLFFPVVL
uniref:SRS domain-containing protein n=1 Tax=Neospora caninum (strain Liverpool) TaxID=572307 RepID=F0JB66_NEOCL|nr:SRS domain-containing protein [Neospora caninum Liverpool]CEL71333.1 TPA: SRS domain-containing protein [Neospora caninum Liverpool]